MEMLSHYSLNFEIFPTLSKISHDTKLKKGSSRGPVEVNWRHINRSRIKCREPDADQIVQGRPTLSLTNKKVS